MTKLDTTIATPEGTLIYPALLEARAYTDPKTKKADKARFSVTLLLDKAAAARVMSSYRKVAALALPELDEADYPSLLIDGKREAARRRKLGKDDTLNDLYEGNYLLKASTLADYPPRVVNEHGDPTQDKRLIFSGARGHISGTINFYVDNKTGDHKANMYLNDVMVVPGGEPIAGMGGGRDIKQVFGGVRDFGDTDMDDIPF